METIQVSGRLEFIDAVMEARLGKDKSNPLPISKEGAEELWKMWEYRHRNGADEDYLIFVPKWLADNDFGQQWPYMFAGIEYDDESKGSVLFRDIRLIDPSVIENGMWSEFSLSEATEVLDVSKENDYVDEPGKMWIARSQFAAFEMVDA